MKIGHSAVITSVALALGTGAASAELLPARVSGYEYFIGVPCTINGQSATCDLQFAGWTANGQPSANGWRPYPGNGEGRWTATVDYKGRPKLGGQVTLLSGDFHLLFTDGDVLSGKVTGGTITWPASGQSSICGTNVAVVAMNVRYRVGATGQGQFRGCLQDLPIGSEIPPKIWGKLE
jgi:hypothetical protein